MIDLYGDFPLINIQSINSEKKLASTGGERRYKANEITYGKYDTIILETRNVTFFLHLSSMID